jgi:hypothetical protein
MRDGHPDPGRLLEVHPPDGLFMALPDVIEAAAGRVDHDNLAGFTNRTQLMCDIGERLVQA